MSDENTKKIQSVRGMQDLLPDDHDYFTVIKKAVRHRCRQAGYRRISTPVLEDVALFERSIGGSDAATKEMYKFKMGDNTLGMKPELTAGICRAYIEHGMGSLPQPVQFYAMEPCFRHDRPQKGRYRQFHQVDVEVIGNKDASIDAQVIMLAQKILKDLGIADRFTLHINTIGTAKDRKKYENALRDYFVPKMRNLSFESQERLEKNPLRILDSKDEDDKILAELAPKFEDFLSAESKEYFNKVQGYLNKIGIQYEVNQKLVRGLDYYTDTVFEFVDQDGLSVCGGGSYDGLIEILGGQPTPGIGFGMGMERVINHLKDAGVVPPPKDKVDVYIACLGDAAKGVAMKLLSDLHDRGIHARGAIGKASIKTQMRNADKFGAPWALLLGDVEVREGKIIVKNMTKGEQEVVPFEGILEHIMGLIERKPDVWKLGE